MTSEIAEALSAVAGMMDRLQREPLADTVKADAVRDLGCLKLQLIRSTRRLPVLEALCGQLREVHGLSDLVDRVEVAIQADGR
jgi:hypothetical protein